MGFTVTVEGNFEGGFAHTRLPTENGGKAVFAFLMALGEYCISNEDMQPVEWYQWIKQFQTYIEQPICDDFKPIMDCVWGDGGGFGGDFFEDEYEWYLKRHPSSENQFTESEFRKFIIGSTKRWSRIDAVIANTELLINVFKNRPLTNVDGLYIAEDMIPDFESLLDTLKILNRFRYENVRLNFA